MIQITTMLSSKCTQFITITIMLYYVNSHMFQSSMALHLWGQSLGGGEREREKLTDCCVHLWLMWLTCKGNSDYRWFCVYMLSLKHNPCVKCDATVYVMFVTICETNATFLNLTWKGSYSFLISSKNDRKFSQGRQKNKVWRGPLHPHRLVCLLINSV